MNDETIAAWMRYRDDGATVITTYQFEGGIPLYRHPYKATPLEQERLLMNADYVIGMMREEIEKLKTRSPLSDGEIYILANRHLKGIEIEYESAGVYEFARAILREAQEK